MDGRAAASSGHIFDDCRSYDIRQPLISSGRFERSRRREWISCFGALGVWRLEKKILRYHPSGVGGFSPSSSFTQTLQEARRKILASFFGRS